MVWAWGIPKGWAKPSALTPADSNTRDKSVTLNFAFHCHTSLTTPPKLSDPLFSFDFLRPCREQTEQKPDADGDVELDDDADCDLSNGSANPKLVLHFSPGNPKCAVSVAGQKVACRSLQATLSNHTQAFLT